MGLCHLILDAIFEYETPKIVNIQSKRIGLINRLIQLVIIGYIVGYVIVYEKGYQTFDTVVGSVSTKVKGYSFANKTLASDKPGIWDVADYIVPPQENGAVFITTNAVITYNQRQTTCPESIYAKDFCTEDANCTAYTMKFGGNGYRTGKCVNSTVDGIKVCEIYAWCPVENDTLLSEPLLTSAENFTLFIKNNIHFPKFKKSRRNIVGFENNKELKNCRYDPNSSKNKYCPIFVIGEIIKNYTQSDFSDLVKRGASLQIIIDWDCDFDDDDDKCLPVYGFRRLDEKSEAVSQGYNFRYANYFHMGNESVRTLVKAFGIQLIITVQGKAGKFNVIPLILNIASGLALLSLASVMCDIIMLYVLKSKNFYRESKYQNVDDSKYSAQIPLG